MKKILLFTMAIFCSSASFAARKNNAPYVGYAYPAGAKRGTELIVIVGGMNFRNLKGGIVSGKGVDVLSAKLFKPFKRLRNDAKREIKPILQAIDTGKDPFAASKKEAKRIQKRIKRQLDRTKKLNAETKSKSAKIAKKPEVKNKQVSMNYDQMMKIVPGERLIYLDLTPEELIKKIKALSKVEYQCLLKLIFTRPNNLQTAPAIAKIAIIKIKISPDAELGFRELRLKSRDGLSNPIRYQIGDLPETKDPIYNIAKKRPPKQLKFGTVVNGQISPGEVERYKFNAKKGENYAFELEGRSLVPFLSDAVPGWFQPIISIHDQKGCELAFGDDNLFKPDPTLSFKPPADGEYEIRVRDSIYRGREDFVYRLKATLGVPKAITTKPLKFRVALPRSTESESNDALTSANAISISSLVSGKISKPGDVDIFSFEGKKGEKIVAEVFARRIDSPMDSILKLLDSQGKTLEWSDDYKWPNVGLKTHLADSYILHELPADGKYFLKVYDAQAKGGDAFNYVLRFDKPRPNFKVFSFPSAINARTRISTPVEMRVWRMDGFKGPVDIVLKKAPKGMKISGGRIPSGVDKTTMTVTIPGKSKKGVFDIVFAGKAEIDGKTIINDAYPSDDIMQAFLYRHIVPSQHGVVYVPRQGWLPVKPPSIKKITMAPGKSFEIKLLNYRHGKVKNDTLVFELLSPPKGLTLRKTSYANKYFLLELKTTPDIKPWTGNIIIQCVVTGIHKKNGKRFFYPIGALPAIPAVIAK